MNMTKTLIFIAAVLFVSSAAAQPLGRGLNPGQGMSPQMGMGRGMPPLIEPIFMGHGFAMDGDEYHILHVNAVKAAVVPPDYVRSLLGEDRAPGEIIQEITSARRITEVRAHLVFAGKSYALNITEYGNSSLSGDVLTLPPYGTPGTEFESEVVGHISLSMLKYEGELLSTGSLTMDGKDYRVLLTSPMGKGMGRPAGFPR